MSEEQRISELIRAQIAVTLTEMGLAKIVEDRALMSYLAGELAQQAIASSPALYNSLAQSLTLPVGEIALAEARAMAVDRATTLVTQMAQSDIRAIGEAVARGLERGDGVQAIARRLETVKELNAPQAKRLDKYIRDMLETDLPDEKVAARAERMRQKLLRERKEMIAQAEARYAVEEAHRVEARAAGKKYKSWITSMDERVSDGCEENQAAGWIKIDKAFPSGDMKTPRHPRCRCTIAYRSAPPDKTAKERQQLREEATLAAKGEV